MPRSTTLLAALARAGTLLPPLSNSTLHKGQSGRIGVVGGSSEYTGAPFYASMAALRTGIDLCHVFCAREAAVVIKSYAPELVVHPYLYTSDDLAGLSSSETDARIQSIMERIEPLLARLDALVVGPGLSRDEFMIKIAAKLVHRAKSMRLPLVIDADGLFVIQKDPDLVRGHAGAVLTPNANEFKRLCDAVGLESGLDRQTASLQLSKALGTVTILSKGDVDIITNSDTVVACDTHGSPRRCGGQGDILAGTVAAFLAWSHRYRYNSAPSVVNGSENSDPSSTEDLLAQAPCLAACAGAHLTREAALAAFQQHGRSVLATDILREIGPTFARLFDSHSSL